MEGIMLIFLLMGIAFVLAIVLFFVWAASRTTKPLRPAATKVSPYDRKPRAVGKET